MLRQASVFMLMLVAVFCVPSLAQEDEISSANRFLSAEASRQIKTSQDEVLNNLKAYQDENFMVLDQRMSDTMKDMRLQVILATIGSLLVAGSIITLIIVKASQRYSYEKFQEGMLSKQSSSDQVNPSSSLYQQPVWDIHQPQSTMGMQFGQAAASQQSQMNSWQMAAPYDGAWVPPQDHLVREAGWNPYPQEYQQPHQQEEYR